MENSIWKEAVELKMSFLIENITVDDLILGGLYEKGVFSQEMNDEIKVLGLYVYFSTRVLRYLIHIFSSSELFLNEAA